MSEGQLLTDANEGPTNWREVSRQSPNSLRSGMVCLKATMSNGGATAIILSLPNSARGFVRTVVALAAQSKHGPVILGWVGG